MQWKPLLFSKMGWGVKSEFKTSEKLKEENAYNLKSEQDAKERTLQRRGCGTD